MSEANQLERFVGRSVTLNTIFKQKSEMMAKILTDQELGEIVWKATHDMEVIDCADSYEHFLEDLADLICDHFGGVPGKVSPPDDELSWTVGIHVNECVPAGGGIFKGYDTDVRWENGEELDNDH